MERHIFSVTEVNELVKLLLDNEPMLSGICVRGEISNYKMYPSGHHYFSLKDPTGAIRCVMFKGQALRLRFRPENGMKVLVDEAHGTHFYFGENLPLNAMAAGADMAAVSVHKTGGSLTQSSFLLCGKDVNHDYVRQIINLTQTTSGSYLLMVSLDLARKNLSLHGKEIFAKTL